MVNIRDLVRRGQEYLCGIILEWTVCGFYSKYLHASFCQSGVHFENQEMITTRLLACPKVPGILTILNLQVVDCGLEFWET